MATTQPSQPLAQPQQPPPPTPQQQQQLPQATILQNNLQSMLNLVFVQSGKYLKEQKAGGGLGRAKFNWTRSVPTASARFQDHLDVLEAEMRQAQAVLRRDLALLQADRLKREQAEAAERQRLAAAKNNTIPVKEDAAVQSAATENREEPKVSKDSTGDAETPRPEPQASDSNQAEKPSAPPTVNTSAPPSDPLFDPTPTTANAQDTEFDFDAMFGESVGGAGATTDNANEQGDVDMDAPAPDLNFTLDDSGPSLLRGLEDFAKRSDDGNTGQSQSGANLDLDFAMPDLPDLPTNQPSDPPAATKPEETSSTPRPADQTEGAGDMLETMTHDDLDDLFNMDYDPPETTEFENAFYGFDET